MSAQRVIITGAASGLGLCTAAHFLKAGAQVLFVDRDPRVSEIAREHGALGHVADLSTRAAAAEVIAAAVAAFGGLDVLVSNAGINIKRALADFSFDEWDLVQAVNTRATWALGVAALPYLSESKGNIVATTSVAGTNPTPLCAAYSASKAAQIMLVKQMALEWGPLGIRANCVSPGSVPTGMSPERYASAEGQALARARNPLREIGRPEDIAAAIFYLASPAARFISGSELVVDGGMQVTLAERGAAGLQKAG